MSALAPLVVAIALLWITLGIAKRYLVSMGVPTGWMSIPRILRGCWRLVAGTVAGLWRAGRGASRFIQGRRKVRRLPGRAPIATPRRQS
jgi:hypothetical protein